MKGNIKKASLTFLELLMIICLCACSSIKQYGILRPPDSDTSTDSKTVDLSSDSQTEVRNAFYLDQTISMDGFCRKQDDKKAKKKEKNKDTGYTTTIFEVYRLLKENVNEKTDIYRYDVAVNQINESVFIKHYYDGELNYLRYYNGIAPPKVAKNAKTNEAKNKGKVKPLQYALDDAFETFVDENENTQYKYSKYKDGLCVFTTDGYEQNRDYSVLTATLGKTVFKRGNAVAFMGIRSYFDGKIYRVSNDPADNYSWHEPRMFYLVVAGPLEKVVSFSSDLSERLNNSNIENQLSILLAPNKTRTLNEESITLEPEDGNAESLEEVVEGKSFRIDDSSSDVIKEEDQEYYPTFSAKLLKGKQAMSSFSIRMKNSEGVTVPQIQVKPTIMIYKGFHENDEPDDDSATSSKKRVSLVSGEPDLDAVSPEDIYTLGNKTLENFVLSNVSPSIEDSIAVEAIEKDGKLQIKTVFKDSSVLDDIGDILVKYSVCIAPLDGKNDIPQWVIDESAYGFTTDEEKAKTLNLEYLYRGLMEACNASMNDGEILTFYCYYKR